MAFGLGWEIGFFLRERFFFARQRGKKNWCYPLFFLGRHTTAAGREARMTEVEPQRPEAGSTTDPIAPTEPAVGMRAGR